MFRLARESIQMQNSMFFKELTLACDTLADVPVEEMQVCNELLTLTAVVKKYTNLKIDFEIVDIGPAIFFPQITKNHPLVSEVRKAYAQNSSFLKLVNQVGNIYGSVNLKTGQVSGKFLDVPIKIYLPPSFMSGTKYSGEERAAVILHEIGHGVTYFEYISRSVTTNQVLSGLSREWSRAETEQDRETLLISTKTALKLNQGTLGDLAKCRDEKVVEAVVVSAVVEESRAELGNNIYDSTSWEYLSDEYVARQGGGRALITALEKLHREHGDIAMRSMPTYLFYEAVKLLLLVASVTPVGPFTFWCAFVMILSDGANSDYDTCEARMIRVKHQLVERLKNTRIRKEEVENITEDLKLIEDLLKNVNDKRQFLSVVWDFFVPSARRDRDFTKLQKDLEDIANNDLFTRAAEIKLALSSN